MSTHKRKREARFQIAGGTVLSDGRSTIFARANSHSPTERAGEACSFGLVWVVSNIPTQPKSTFYEGGNRAGDHQHARQDSIRAETDMAERLQRVHEEWAREVYGGS